MIRPTINLTPGIRVGRFVVGLVAGVVLVASRGATGIVGVDADTADRTWSRGGKR
jgi:hypothetical protein